LHLDVATLLPAAITFNAHPDDNPGSNISIEIDFSNYQAIAGVTVPMHIQKYVQGTLTIDFTGSTATFNTGLPLSDFAIKFATAAKLPPAWLTPDLGGTAIPD